MPADVSPTSTLHKITWMPLASFLVSIPTFAAVLPQKVFTANGCSGGFLDTVPECSNLGFSPIYNVFIALTFVATLLSVVIVPLALRAIAKSW